MFEGVFSVYTPPGEDPGSFMFYRVSASVGITARVYGEVDFVVISVGFSIEFTAIAALTLESYRKGALELSVELRVSAHIKIFFVKIKFSFSFTWKDSFAFGQNSIAPWDGYLAEPVVFPVEPARRIPEPEWYNGAVLSEIRELQAEITPYFSLDNFGAADAGERRKIGWLICLQGYQDNTLEHLAYDNAAETPLPVLVLAMLRRVFRSYGVGETTRLSELLDIQDAFAQNGHTGFTIESLCEFFSANVVFRIINSLNAGFDGEIHGVPMPCPPVLVLTWMTGEEKQQFDLASDPIVPADFSQRLREYFEDIGVMNTKKPHADYANSSADSPLSASAVLFSDYFYMLAKLALAQVVTACEASDEEEIRAEALIAAILEKPLDNISGQLSRFLLGGLRTPIEGKPAPMSLYEYAHQQFDGMAPGVDAEAESHRLTLLTDCAWVALGERTAELSSSGQSMLALYTNTRTLEISLKNKHLKYPDKAPLLPAPELLPVCVWRDVVTETKPPIGIGGAQLCEVAELLPKPPYQVMCIGTDGEEHSLEFAAVFAIRIPIERAQDDFYSVGCIDSRSAAALALLRTAENPELELYRNSNEIDRSPGINAPEEAELLPVDMEHVFLYRINLCLEAEKPEIERADSAAENSALATAQPGMFLSLLADACSVNARGYIGRIISDADADISSGKIKPDGLLAVSIHARDTGLQKELRLNLRYTLTDWALRGHAGTSYLSLLTPPENEFSVVVPLPYKRYPEKAELVAHSSVARWQEREAPVHADRVSPEELFGWSYEVCLSHKTMAQDTMKVKISHGLPHEESPMDALWAALAQYMHLRDRLLADLEANAERFADVVRAVADSLVEHLPRRKKVPPNEYFSYEVDRVEHVVAIRESSLEQPPGFAVLDEGGEFAELAYDAARGSYILPDEYSPPLIQCKISFNGFQIAQQNLTQSSVSVTRNANIDNIPC